MAPRRSCAPRPTTAIASGVFGVPTLALGDQLFWGTDTLPMARAYLADPHLFDDPEMRRVDHLPTGAGAAAPSGGARELLLKLGLPRAP